VFSRSRLLQLTEAMAGRLIVVYGDIVADRFVYGTPKRISREAPVLILRQYRDDILLGGAGNAINNIVSLGGVPLPVSVVGDDAAGRQLLSQLTSQGIDCSGVLHHMADPLEGWRILLTLLRPGGLMHLGFYSEAGRKDVVAARSFIADRGFGSRPPEIRRCRQELLNTPLAGVARFADFFTTSECRDLLFHVHEARMTIPAIAAFIGDHHLKFLGFEFDAPDRLRNHFAASGWSLTDLDRWHEFETRHPNTFSGMYQFWVQKP